LLKGLARTETENFYFHRFSYHWLKTKTGINAMPDHNQNHRRNNSVFRTRWVILTARYDEPYSVPTFHCDSVRLDAVSKSTYCSYTVRSFPAPHAKTRVAELTVIGLATQQIIISSGTKSDLSDDVSALAKKEAFFGFREPTNSWRRSRKDRIRRDEKFVSPKSRMKFCSILSFA